MKPVSEDPRVKEAMQRLALVATERRGETRSGPNDVLKNWSVASDYGVFTVSVRVVYKRPSQKRRPRK